MPNYDQVLIHLDEAHRSCKDADNVLAPKNKATPLEAYILGMIRAANIVLIEAHASMEAGRVRLVRKKAHRRKK